MNHTMNLIRKHFLSDMLSYSVLQLVSFPDHTSPCERCGLWHKTMLQPLREKREEEISHLQREDVLRESLDGFKQEALETEAGLALVVLLLEESNKLGLLLDGLLQYVHGCGKVIDVLIPCNA